MLLSLLATGATLLAPAPSSAARTLINTNHSSGWAASTALYGQKVNDVPLPRPAQPDPNDPPVFYSDGQVHYLLSHWGAGLCTEAGYAPTVLVADSAGNQVAGVVTTEEVSGKPQPRAVRWTVSDPAYPHGLALGRNDGSGGGPPYEITTTVYFLGYFGECDTTAPLTVGPQVFAIDRFLPNAPSITNPTSLATNTPPRQTCTNNTCYPIEIPRPMSGQVLVTGAVSDPLTMPYRDIDPAYATVETSGIKAVVVAVWQNLSTIDVARSSRLVRSFTWLNPACDEPWPIDESGATGIRRCSDSVSYSVDITESLEAGNAYEITAYAIDLAGFRRAPDPAEAATLDNLNGPPAIRGGARYPMRPAIFYTGS